MSTHNICFSWRTSENDPRIIIKYFSLTTPLVIANWVDHDQVSCSAASALDHCLSKSVFQAARH